MRGGRRATERERKKNGLRIFGAVAFMKREKTGQVSHKCRKGLERAGEKGSRTCGQRRRIATANSGLR